MQNGLAATLDVPLDKVRVIWTTGPGSYGRNDADDCAMDAAVLAKAVGRPVRLQYMREQGTGWDPKGPASIHRARARSTRPATSSPMSSPARASRASTSTPTAASRSTRSPDRPAASR